MCALGQAIRAHCRVLHFTGHGLPEGVVCFEDESGVAHPLREDELKDLFEKARHYERWVFPVLRVGLEGGNDACW